MGNLFNGYFMKIIALVLMVVTLTLDVFCQNSETFKLPNISCILTDDLGYGDLSVQGTTDLQTPNIDRLTKEGMIMTNFYVNSTVCSPSRAALLSGKYPDYLYLLSSSEDRKRLYL